MFPDRTLQIQGLEFLCHNCYPKAQGVVSIVTHIMCYSSESRPDGPPTGRLDNIVFQSGAYFPQQRSRGFSMIFLSLMNGYIEIESVAHPPFFAQKIQSVRYFQHVCLFSFKE